MLLVGDQLAAGSVYRLLAEHGAALFGDEYFADLFKRSALGRPTVPARVVATVMLLQAYEGLSDRETCDRLPGSDGRSSSTAKPIRCTSPLRASADLFPA